MASDMSATEEISYEPHTTVKSLKFPTLSLVRLTNRQTTARCSCSGGGMAASQSLYLLQIPPHRCALAPL